MFEQYRLNGQVLTSFAFFCCWCDRLQEILSVDSEGARWVLRSIDRWREVRRFRYVCRECCRELEG